MRWYVRTIATRGLNALRSRGECLEDEFLKISRKYKIGKIHTDVIGASTRKYRMDKEYLWNFCITNFYTAFILASIYTINQANAKIRNNKGRTTLCPQRNHGHMLTFFSILFRQYTLTKKSQIVASNKKINLILLWEPVQALKHIFRLCKPNQQSQQSEILNTCLSYRSVQKSSRWWHTWRDLSRWSDSVCSGHWAYLSLIYLFHISIYS